MPETATYQPSTATLDTVKEFIHKYKTTNDPSYIEDILILVDNLLVSIVFRVKKTYKFLKRVSLQEIYQTAVIGLYEAIDKIHEGNEPAILIPARINSYVIANVKKSYAYLEKGSEAFKDADGQEMAPEWDAPKTCRPPNGSQMVVEDLNSLVACHIITKWDCKLLTDRYIKGMRNDEMAEKREIGTYTVSRRIKLILKKVAVYFK
jgi:DNA-directed RNA polymerase specialized sigma subunit